jgi:hypothetical protein
MNTNIQQIRIFSEDGNREYPYELVIDMDGTKPTCPITFYSAGIPVFSLGSDEVDQFCEELQKLVP